MKKAKKGKGEKTLKEQYIKLTDSFTVILSEKKGKTQFMELLLLDKVIIGTNIELLLFMNHFKAFLSGAMIVDKLYYAGKAIIEYDQKEDALYLQVGRQDYDETLRLFDDCFIYKEECMFMISLCEHLIDKNQFAREKPYSRIVYCSE